MILYGYHLPSCTLSIPKLSIGHRQCVGKRLALTEVRLMVATLLKRYDISFLAGQDIDSVVDDMKGQVTAQPGECRFVFTPRKG